MVGDYDDDDETIPAIVEDGNGYGIVMDGRMVSAGYDTAQAAEDALAGIYERVFDGDEG